MATKNEPKQEQTAPKGFKSFKRDLKFYELKPNTQLKGTLVSARQQTIRDTRSKKEKQIWVYRIKLENEDRTIQLGGREMLDQQFHDAADDLCGGDMDSLRGVPVIINRGDDTTTRDGNPMGTYELMVGELPTE